MKKKIAIMVVMIAVLGAAFFIYSNFYGSKTTNESVTVSKNIDLTPAELDQVTITAEDHVIANSVKKLHYSMELMQILPDWVRIDIDPVNNDTEPAQMYLQKVNGVWTVKAFGTAFPDLWEEHPEIFDENLYK